MQVPEAIGLIAGLVGGAGALIAVGIAWGKKAKESMQLEGLDSKVNVLTGTVHELGITVARIDERVGALISRRLPTNRGE